MRLNLSYRAAKLFRKITTIFALLGIILGLAIAASIPSLRHSILFWVLAPIILGFFMACLVIGYYLIFLNNKKR